MRTPLPPSGYPTGPAPLRGTRPKEVELSCGLWIATLVLGVIGLVLIYVKFRQTQAQMINQMVVQNPSMDQSMIERAVTTAFVVWLLCVAAMFLFVFLMRAGRNWARIVLAVLGGLYVLLSLIGVAVAGSIAGVGLLQLLLLVGAIVTMFLPAANAWFAPRRPVF